MKKLLLSLLISIALMACSDNTKSQKQPNEEQQPASQEEQLSASEEIVAKAWADHEKLRKGEFAYNTGDYQTALQIFYPLAEQGNGMAQNYMGVMVLRGEGVTPNPVKAVEWFRLSAESGDSGGQYNLAQAYENAFGGVVKNKEKAMFWMEKSAAQGNVDARYRFAEWIVYTNSDYEDYKVYYSVPDDKKELVKTYLTSACDSNVERACYLYNKLEETGVFK